MDPNAKCTATQGLGIKGMDCDHFARMTPGIMTLIPGSATSSSTPVDVRIPRKRRAGNLRMNSNSHNISHGLKKDPSMKSVSAFHHTSAASADTGANSDQQNVSLCKSSTRPGMIGCSSSIEIGLKTKRCRTKDKTFVCPKDCVDRKDVAFNPHPGINAGAINRAEKKYLSLRKGRCRLRKKWPLSSIMHSVSCPIKPGAMCTSGNCAKGSLKDNTPQPRISAPRKTSSQSKHRPAARLVPKRDTQSAAHALIKHSSSGQTSGAGSVFGKEMPLSARYSLTVDTKLASQIKRHGLLGPKNQFQEAKGSVLKTAAPAARTQPSKELVSSKQDSPAVSVPDRAVKKTTNKNVPKHAHNCHKGTQCTSHSQMPACCPKDTKPYKCSTSEHSYALTSDLHRHVPKHDSQSATHTLIKQHSSSAQTSGAGSLSGKEMPLSAGNSLIADTKLASQSKRHGLFDPKDPKDQFQEAKGSVLKTAAPAARTQSSKELVFSKKDSPAGSVPDRAVKKTTKKNVPKHAYKCHQGTQCTSHSPRPACCPRDTKPYKCSICEHSYALASGLHRHVKGAHNDMISYTCIKCGKTLLEPDEWRPKQKARSGNKLFECTECRSPPKDKPSEEKRKQFHSSDKLIHLCIKLFVCPVCDQSFFRSRDLEDHMYFYTQHKTYLCGVCGDKYKELRTLVRHVQTMHVRT